MTSPNVTIGIRFQPFRLPPVESALAVGKRALIGPRALHKALEEMMPGVFELLMVESNDIVEAIIVRRNHLIRVPAAVLVPLITGHARKLMDQTETLQIWIDVDIRVVEELTL